MASKKMANLVHYRKTKIRIVQRALSRTAVVWRPKSPKTHKKRRSPWARSNPKKASFLRTTIKKIQTKTNFNN